MGDLIDMLAARLKNKQPISVIGSNTKGFLGGALTDEPLSMREHAGIVNYEPTELVLTAKAGTALSEINSLLAKSGQMLPFEPPMFGEDSTLGGAMASGLSGPRRIHLGSARDAILGLRLINGLGQHLRFGGEVMKNVAGYDLSRLSVGAFGTLGILTEISVKVLPLPEQERTQMFTYSNARALSEMIRIGRHPYPVSAITWVNDMLYVRLSGTGRGVDAAAKALGGETLANQKRFWNSICHHMHPSFKQDQEWLWRLSLPPTTPVNSIPFEILDWAGAQRWVHAAPFDYSLFELAESLGGHATCFSGERVEGTGMQPLKPLVMQLSHRVKKALDPFGLINRGRFLEEAS
jgi:glycolate oxidase FAD binding subunit